MECGCRHRSHATARIHTGGRAEECEDVYGQEGDCAGKESSRPGGDGLGDEGGAVL